LKDQIKTALVLGAIAFISALILSVTDKVTREPIKNVQIQKKIKARKEILPAKKYTKVIIKNLETILKQVDKNSINGKKVAITKSTQVGNYYYKAYSENNEIVGYVFEMISPAGYGGDIEIVVGVKIKTNEFYGKPVISDYTVIRSTETPGLGKAVEVKLHKFFKDKAKGLTEINTKSKVDTITGATITSSAIKDSLYTALKLSDYLLKANWENLAIPERAMRILPFGVQFSPIKLINKYNFVREVYNAKYFRYNKGIIVKVFFSSNGQKYLGLIGFQTAKKRIYRPVVYKVSFDKKKPFVMDKSFNLRSYIFAKKDKILKMDSKKATEIILKKVILEAWNTLEKMGKL